MSPRRDTTDADTGDLEPAVDDQPARETPTTEPTEQTEPTTDASEPKPYIAKVADPEPPAPAEETTEEAIRLTLPEGEVRIVYRGLADAFTAADRTFRHGEPVTVPSEVAEELLTFPNEPFELLDQQKE